jgi:hypothetical protein
VICEISAIDLEATEHELKAGGNEVGLVAVIGALVTGTALFASSKTAAVMADIGDSAAHSTR